MSSPLRAFLRELQRRRVYRVAAVYLLVGWGLLQLGDVIIEPLQLPDWTMPLVIVLVGLGFPVALVLAWAFDITPDGVRRAQSPDDAAPAGTPTSPTLPASPTSVLGTRRAAGLVGLGVLIGIVGVGWYAFTGGAPGAGDGALEAGVAAGDAAPVHSIAVLPFANSSPDADNEFFADGVTDDILTHLALVPDFSVISRTTAMRYKGSDRSALEIATELGVGYVLEGSVRRADDRVLITARLVDGRTDRHLWAETYDRRLSDIFQVQTDIARAIARALETELSSSVAARIERRPTTDLQAYDLFLLGRDHFYRYDRQSTANAMETFSRALERDPGFTLARAWLARAYAIYGFNHGGGPAYGDSAIAIARRAVAEQPDLPDAHAALGTALATTGHLDEAIPALERALELNANDFASMANLGLLYAQMGRLDHAVRLTRRSLARDPARAFLGYSNLASYYLQLGQFEESERLARIALELNPAYLQSVFLQGWFDFWIHDRPEGTRAAMERLAATGDPRYALDAGHLAMLIGERERARDLLAVAYAGAPTAVAPHPVGLYYAWSLLETGDQERARAVLAETERIHSRSLTGSSALARFSTAGLHALRGDTVAALAALEGAIEAGLGIVLLPYDPVVMGLRDDSRFIELHRRSSARAAAMRETVELGGW
jgi:adenylate cyclase